MGAFYEAIPESMLEWARAQKCFWVATAPLHAKGGGHVNVCHANAILTAPKGGPYFGVPSRTKFWYMDLTGSGNETISHLNEPGNGRITILFNAFEGPPRILRLWGHGTVVENGTPAFDSLVSEYSITCLPGLRSIIVVDIHQVGSSCGFSVPYYDFKEFRPILNDFFAKKEKKFVEGKKEESMDHYWAYKNAHSMDGLPGMKRALKAQVTYGVAPIKKMVGPWAPKKNLKAYINGDGTFGVVQFFLVLLIGILFGFGLATWRDDARLKVQELLLPVLEGARTNLSTPSPAQILKK